MLFYLIVFTILYNTIKSRWEEVFAMVAYIYMSINLACENGFYKTIDTNIYMFFLMLSGYKK